MIEKDKKYFDGHQNGLESADGTSFPNSFYEFKLLLQHFRKETQ